MKKIAISGDHAGYQYKDKLIRLLQKEGYEVINFGTDNGESVDYPDFIHPLAHAMNDKNVELGIIICGSGNGVSMTANKHAHIRAALCWKIELAELARQHNNANVLAIPARFVSYEMARKMVLAFIRTAFEGGRHERRVNKIPC